MRTGDSYKELVSFTSTGAIIVQTALNIEARCVKCTSMIAWSGSYWYCANSECMKKIKRVDRSVRSSILNLDSSITKMTMWVSAWLDVPTEDVRVVVTR